MSEAARGMFEFSEPPEAFCPFEGFGDQPVQVPIGGSRSSKGVKKKKSDDDDDAGYTTVMLRNIPNKYTRQMLIEQLHCSGFRGDIDYLYLPIDFANRCNVGYCFANFRTSAARQRFNQVFDGVAVQSCLPGFNSYKVCQVTRAKWQGREENVKRLRSGTELMSQLAAHPEWLPLLLDEAGNVEAFHVGQGLAPAVSMPKRQTARKGGWGGERQAVPENWAGLPGLIDQYPGGGGAYGGPPGRGAGKGSGRRGGGRGSYMYQAGDYGGYPGGGGQSPYPGMPMVPGIPVMTEQGIQYMPYDAAYEAGYAFSYPQMRPDSQLHSGSYMSPYGAEYSSGWWGSEAAGGSDSGYEPSGRPPPWPSALYQNKFDTEPQNDDDAAESA